MSGTDPMQVLEEQIREEEKIALAPLVQHLRNLIGWAENEIQRLLGHHRHHKRQIVLLQPIFADLTTGEIVMADIQLPLNQSYTAVITEFNPTTQGFDPVDPADVFTPTVTDTVNIDATVAPFVPPANATPSQTALAGIPALTVQWLHAVSPMPVAVGVTLTDTAGSSPVTLEFDMIAANAVPDQLGIDAADAVFTTIATPV
jgi:hypothetical protein